MGLKLEVVESPRRTGKENVVTINTDSKVPIDKQFEDQKDIFENVVREAIEAKCFICKGEEANPKGFCRNCITSTAPFLVPYEEKFELEDSDILAAPEIAEIGKMLIDYYFQDFGAIRGAEIVYLWKKKGGASHGKLTLGKCKKPSGELKFFSDADFIIVLGADNCEGLNRYQITALIYHELKHAGYNVEKNEYELISHDFEGFGREVEIFGDWKSDIGKMRRSFARSEQQSLF